MSDPASAASRDGGGLVHPWYSGRSGVACDSDISDPVGLSQLCLELQERCLELLNDTRQLADVLQHLKKFLESNRTKFTVAMTASSTLEIQAGVERLEARAQSDEDIQILGWLSGTNANSKHQTVRKPRLLVPTTGKWLFR